jgi:ribonuclease E
MSENNLPVLWVPPVPPQAPENRPPRASRRPQIVTLAALLIGTPILAWATMTGNDTPADRATVAEVAVATPKPVAPQPQKAAAPAPVRLAETATSAGPATSGGSQPYLTDAPAAAKAKPEAKPAKETATAPAAVDAEGRPVRVIDMNQRSDGETAVEPKPVAPPVATAAPHPAAENPDAVKSATPDAKKTAAPDRPAPATAAAKAEPKPPVTPPAPVAAKDTPSPAAETVRGPVAEPPPAVTAKAPVPAPPSELRSTIDTPPAARSGEAATVVAPKPADAAPPREHTPAPEIAAKPTVEKPATVTAAPKPTSGATSVVTVAPPATPKKPAKIPEPRPKEAAPALAGGPDAPARTESRDFADRLATVRREEGRRLRAAPSPIEEDDGEIVAPRRGWSIFPSFEDEAPPRPVLRPFSPPPRVAERPVGHSNCHFHAWPTEEMEFHRDVQCHWHRNARDTSLRYVR